MHRLILIALASSTLGACTGSLASNGTYPTVAQTRQACADAGVAPGSGGFSSCATNLQQAIRDDADIQG